MSRWWIFYLCLLVWSVDAESASHPTTCRSTWGLWNTFVEDFVQVDGRVMDANTPFKHTTSESQAYGMLFALIANDQEQFKRIWLWTQHNLMGSDIQNNLPAWQWGKGKDGQWGIQDRNAASDADVWMAYALLEAGRVWKVDAFKQDAYAMLRLIKEKEHVNLPDVGMVLMPGLWGYIKEDSYKLNASYWPLPVMRRLAQEDPAGPWHAMASHHVDLISAMSPKGMVPDWVVYQKSGQGTYALVADTETGAVGSYDAIRVYLWAGMTSVADPLANKLLKAVSGFKPLLMGGHVPEKVDVSTGLGTGDAPNGFYAALLPYFSRLHAREVGSKPILERWLGGVQTRMQNERLKAYASKQQPVYYDQVLVLFGVGWMEKYYRFLPDGRMQFKWEVEC